MQRSSSRESADTVASWLRRVGPFDVVTAVRVALQACAAVRGEPGKLTPTSIALEPDGDELGVRVTEPSVAPPTSRDAGSLLGEMLSGAVAPPELMRVAPWVDPALAALVDSASHGPPMSLETLVEALLPFSDGALSISRAALSADDAGTFEDDGPSAPQARTSPDPLVGSLLGDRYRVVRWLGRGGMGAVYEATAPDGQRVAAKVLGQVGASGPALQRFFREARAATSVDHPHVVRTLELAHDRALGAPFLVMELLHGRDLAALVAERGAIEAGPLVRLFVDAARGIAALHARGVVHRDIKPANLFLHADDEQGPLTIKVLDFGIAKRTATSGEESTTHDLTRTGGMVGSPAYMSPEQARNAKAVDLRTDIWSLSASLLEALSGRRLWPQSALGELIVAIATSPIPRVQELAAWLPEALADVVQRGLSRDPADRWPTATAMADALEVHASGGPVTLQDLVHVDDERLATRGKPSIATPHPEAVGAASVRTTSAGATSRRRLALAAIAIAAASTAITVGLTRSRAPAARQAGEARVTADDAAPSPSRSAAAVDVVTAVAPSAGVSAAASTERLRLPTSRAAPSARPPVAASTPRPPGVKPEETW